MADWRAELDTLLSHLNVSLEQGIAPGRHDGAAQRGRDEDATLDELDADARVPAEASQGEDALADGDEVSAVRSEIEATVRRVIELTQAGKLDTSLRDDVVFVLQALTRPRPRGVQSRPRRRGAEDSSSEWQLASAAAVLHFCRIVLRLTQAAAAEPEA
jgi:hypothetical protein